MNIMQFNFKGALKFVIPSVFFYVMLNTFFKSLGFSMSSLALLFLLSAGSAFWITRYRFLAIVPAILLSAGSVAFLVTIGQGMLGQGFIMVVSILFAILLIGLERFFGSEDKGLPKERVRFLDSGFNLNQALIMFSVFFLCSGIYGIYIIANIRPWQMLLVSLLGLYFAGFYLIRINYLKSLELGLHLDYYKNRTFNFYPFLVTLCMVELIWVLTFLPINHMTFGAIVLAMFFCYWDIVKSYLRNELTARKFIMSTVFSFLAVSMVLFTSKLYIN